MEFSITNCADYSLIKISGRIDGYTTPYLREALNDLISNGHTSLVVDMKDVPYIASTGILMFVNLQKRLLGQNEGEILFAETHKLVLSSFELAGFEIFFNFFEDISSAVDSF